jgi:hypothetical protein
MQKTLDTSLVSAQLLQQARQESNRQEQGICGAAFPAALQSSARDICSSYCIESAAEGFKHHKRPKA